MTAAVGIKRLGFAVAALTAAAIAALVILPLLISADAVRKAVQAEIRAVTGLDPVLRGQGSVSLFPAGKVSFDDVVLGDNRTGAPALTAEHMVARLRFFPLLIGRIEIADVSLVRPTIAIVFNADRSSNWSGHIDFDCAQRTAFSSVVSPSFDSSSSAPSSRSNTPGPFPTHITRSERRP